MPYDMPKVPNTDDEVEATFCSDELGTTGQAVFQIYKIKRAQGMSVEKAYFETVSYWISIRDQKS